MSASSNRWLRIWRYVVSDVWDLDLASLPRWRRAQARMARILYLTFRGFWDDDCSLHAASLTFNSLMALVPIMALSLALIRGMGAEDVVKTRIRAFVEKATHTLAVHTAMRSVSFPETIRPEEPSASSEPPMTPELFARQIVHLVDEIFAKMDRVNFRAIGGLGLVLLLYTAVAVFSSVETSFNRVWGVTTGRSWWRKFTDYLSLLFVLPILVIGAMSLPAMEMISRMLNATTAEAIRSSLATGLFKTLTVHGLSGLTCSFLIMFMPNTRVGWRAGLVGGLSSGILLVSWLKLCVAVQYGVAKYGAVYGGFAAVPILLAWVFISWQIILLGAELAYATQNYETYRMEQGAGKASPEARIRLALGIVVEAARALSGQGPIFDANRFAAEKCLPNRLVNDVVEELVRSGLLARISETKGSPYVLLRSPETLRISDVIESCLRSGVRPDVFGMDRLGSGVEAAVRSALGGLQASLQELTIRHLLTPPATSFPASSSRL